MDHPSAALADLIAKQEIREVVLRYCRGIDRLDMDLVRGVYHPGGIDHHTGFDGPVEDFVRWVEPLLGQLSGTRHEVHNHLSEVAGDFAVVETYATARHWTVPSADGAPGADGVPGFRAAAQANFSTGVRYVDHMERRDGRWGIVERFAIREWHRVDAEPAPAGAGRAGAGGAGAGGGQGKPGPTGSRGDADPVYALRRKLLGG